MNTHWKSATKLPCNS